MNKKEILFDYKKKLINLMSTTKHTMRRVIQKFLIKNMMI